MNKMFWIVTPLTLLAIITIGLSACGSPGTPGMPETRETLLTADIDRVIDYEAGVVCWVHDSVGSYGTGISCLPCSETLLRIDSERMGCK